MNPRRPSLKLICTIPLIFLTFIAIFIHKSPTTTPALPAAVRDGAHRLKCGNSDDLINNLEPLLAAEPLEVFEGLGDQEQNVKYLSAAVELAAYRRLIYVDVGANDYDSSIGSWFIKQYPKQNKTFEIFAVEADSAFHDEYTQRRDVKLIPYAAWVRNETVSFGSKPIMVDDKVWRLKPYARIEAAAEGMAEVAGFDFAAWLRAEVSPEDFVVVKIDVEGTEIELIRSLVDGGEICLIDELFMECHFDRFVKCCEGERINRFSFSYGQCLDLFKELRDMGIVVHQWW